MKLIVQSFKINDDDLKAQQAKIIDKIARKGVKIFRQEITKRHLINTGNLLNSVSATIGRESAVIEVGAEYAGILNNGVRRHKMRYLVDKGPIPVANKKFFRVATKKNINESGKWVHPGFKRGKGFFDDGVNKIQSVCREIVLDEGLI
jgi:phage gpG-like protein